MKHLLLGILLVVLLATTARADSWLPPSVQSYSSANGSWKLTVYPRGLTSQLDYFKDKVDGKPHAGGVPGDTQASPIGHMQRKQGGRWLTVWKAPLVNDVSPVQAVVSNDGIAVTFDNWHSVGWGDDAVVFLRVGDELQPRRIAQSEVAAHARGVLLEMRDHFVPLVQIGDRLGAVPHVGLSARALDPRFRHPVREGATAVVRRVLRWPDRLAAERGPLQVGHRARFVDAHIDRRALRARAPDHGGRIDERDDPIATVALRAVHEHAV